MQKSKLGVDMKIYYFYDNFVTSCTQGVFGQTG